MGYSSIVSELMEIFLYQIMIIVAKLCEERLIVSLTRERGNRGSKVQKALNIILTVTEKNREGDMKMRENYV